MQRKKLLFSLLFITLIAPAALGQVASETPEKKLSLDEGTVESQFDFITTKSNSFQEYKVVKKTWLAKLESNILDSINSMRSELAEQQASALTRKNNMSTLRDSVAAVNQQLNAAITTKDSITFLGIPTHKYLYNSIMWGVILGLGALLLFFIYRYKRNHIVTAEAMRRSEEHTSELQSLMRNSSA